MRVRPLALACAAGFAFSANYTNHAPMVSALIKEFGFSQARAGLLTTGIFLTHALMQVPGGWLADRFGPARLMAAALAIVCAGNFAIAFSGAYTHLLLWKIFVGLGTGTSFTAGARYIVSIYKGRELHFAQGLYGGSILVGSGFVIFAIPQLLGAFGWSGAFLGSTAVAVLVWLAWMILAEPAPAVVHAPGKLSEMLANPRLWLLGLVQMASFGLVIVAGAWITTLLRAALQMPLKTAGLLGSIVLLLGILTRPLGGALVPRWGIRTVVRCGLVLNAAGCAALATAGSAWMAFAGIVALGVGCGLPYAGIFNFAAALFPGRAGAAMGLVNMIGISMILAGAPLAGLLADWTGQFRASFLALGVFSLAAALSTAAWNDQ